jgi:hypothetical protein
MFLFDLQKKKQGWSLINLDITRMQQEKASILQ